MFNLIMTNQEAGAGPITMGSDRIFEYTDDNIIPQYRINNAPDFDKLLTLPCLFMMEGFQNELAYVGRVTRVRHTGREFLIEHVIDRNIRPVTNAEIYDKRLSYGMAHRTEFSRNHWAVKEEDLFRLLLTHSYPTRQIPKVFTIPPNESVEPDLLSVMMPFDARFNAVYAAIRDYAGTVALRCQRADDIWQHDVIIQDVVSLIDRSRIVICDCTGRNPNVFYETGIAHTLGRDVILITQNADDIPFDLRHIRYIPYLNNAEGHQALVAAIRDRVATLVER